MNLDDGWRHRPNAQGDVDERTGCRIREPALLPVNLHLVNMHQQPRRVSEQVLAQIVNGGDQLANRRIPAQFLRGRRAVAHKSYKSSGSVVEKIKPLHMAQCSTLNIFRATEYHFNLDFDKPFFSLLALPSMLEQILTGDCRAILPVLEAESVQCCVTSPPYWGLRDYGVEGAIGLESTPQEYIAHMVEVFREVWRVLRDDGTLWLNMGDTYAANRSHQVIDNKHIYVGNNGSMSVPPGLKPKDLCMMPARLAMALQADGWYLRSDIIWHKPNPMPESVTDRPTKSHEYIFLLAKQDRYFYDANAIREAPSESLLERWKGEPKRKNPSPQGLNVGSVNGESCMGINSNGRNKRTVWTIATQPYTEAHFATFPEEIPKLCILAGSRLGDTVLDPFAGSGTVGQVALELGRKAVLIELNPAYIELARQRTFTTPGFL
jgi:DNA modification methylase